MSNSILNEQSKHILINRIMALQADSKGAWGKFTVNEMLFHCTKVTNAVLDGKPTENLPTVKQKLIKTLALRMLRHLPKGIQTGAKYLRTENDNLNFTAEQNILIETINTASQRDPIFGIHPFFGPLNTMEWRRFLWMHTDHHLRQFNV